ncbi:tRNA-modifying protein YgfZ [Thalassocella blandensis]|nr:tRNA-modifying protein YgfZ [Thalassocella blandensis]
MFDWTPYNKSFEHDLDTWNTLASCRLPLRRYALLEIEGPDAEKFLQGQCTCDFTTLNEQQRLIGAHCDPKGRMQSSFVAARLDENTIGLRVHYSIVDHALNALKKYIVFSKADIKISERAIVGLHGPRTQKLAEKFVGQALQQQKFASSDGRTVIAHSSECFELWLAPDQVPEFFTATDAVDLNLQSDEPWKQQSIARGEAELTAELIGQLLPQEINLQCIDGISFKKGCYTGQEIVARLHYKGKLKKHMVYGKASTSVYPYSGAAISAADQTIKAKGSIINAVQLETGAVEFLAICDDALLETNDLLFDENSPAKTQWLPLPYAIS